jgi:DNA polymerase-3 subunit epsilon
MIDFKLKRPLVFFDLETTGNDRNKDQIIEFCFLSFHPDGSCSQDAAYVKPGIPVSPSATAVHGICTEELYNRLSFASYAEKIFHIVKDCDLVGFGILQFDVPLLFNELHRNGHVWDYTRCNIIDACNIYKRNTPRDLTAAFKHYCSGKFEDAHSAYADTLATKEVFLSQIVKHQLSIESLETIARFSNYDKPLVDLSGKFTVNDQGDILVNIGNNRGQKALDNISLMYWMLDKDFSEDVKIICRKIIQDHELSDPTTPLLF